MPTIRLSSLAPGISKFSQAIVGGQDAFDQGAEQGATLQGKIAQLLAATQAQEAAARAHDSTTALNGVKTGQEQIQLDAMKPEALRRNAMIGNGIPLDEAPNVDSWLTTGNLGGKYTTPTDGVGPVAPKPAWAEPSSPFAKQIMAMQNAIALGDKNSENVAKAKGLYENQDRISQAIAGTLDPAKLAAAEYAGKGNAPYHFSEFGVGNNLTGKVDDSGPVAQRFGVYRDSETGKNKAQAGQAAAAAAHSAAGTRKINQEIEQGGKTGQIQLMTDGNGNIVGVNKVTMQATPAMGQDGKPLQGKGGTLNGEQANALTFANRMQAAQEILTGLAGKGVLTPGNTKLAAQAVPSWAGGGVLETGANYVQSPEQQQVEQAQRDFINAVLRRESGAAISMGEFSNAAKQYFPQPGDSKQVRQQKMEARQRVIQGMLAAVPANLRTLPAAPGAAPAADAPRNVVVNY